MANETWLEAANRGVKGLLATLATGVDQDGSEGALALRVGGNTKLCTVTFSLDTNIYAAGDVLAATQEVTGVTRRTGGSAMLQSVKILDEDDNAAAAMTAYIFQSNVALGTENAAISIADADARELLATVAIAATDWVDLINSRVAYKNNLNIPVRAASGATSLWVALSTAGTPTQTAAGITGIFGFEQD